MMEPPPTKEIAVAPILVFWDMKRCPVPDGYDARRVGPCIKWNLKKLGYSGPITITAVGSLSKVPRDILEAVTSTGISLKNRPYSRKNMVLLHSGRPRDTPPPSTMMFISRPAAYTPPKFSRLLSQLLQDGHNTIFPFPYDSPQEASSIHAKRLWKNFLLSYPGALEDEDSCSETGEPAIWVCDVCRTFSVPGLAGRGIDNFIAHLSTREHELNLPYWFTPKGDVCLDKDRKADEARVDVTAMLSPWVTPRGYVCLDKDEETDEARVEVPLREKS